MTQKKAFSTYKTNIIKKQQQATQNPQAMSQHQLHEQKLGR